VWQINNFTPVNARYIKLKALKNTWGDDVAGYAEIDLITE
jgi:alpha-L-fucosidase